MDDKESIKYPIAFYLTTGLTTQVIIGNDFLQPRGACINLDRMIMTLLTLPRPLFHRHRDTATVGAPLAIQ
jgi:hypothetical protein